MKESVSARHVNDIMKYDDVDVSPIEPFLSSTNANVRRRATEIIGIRGDVSLLRDAALVEKNKDVLLMMLDHVWRCPTGLEDFVGLLSHEDSAIRQGAVTMYRRAGRADCLISMLFDKDDDLVFRVKKYMKDEMAGSTAKYVVQLKRFRALLSELSNLCGIMLDVELEMKLHELLYAIDERILSEDSY